MLVNNNKEEIRAVANKLKLNDFVIEKDLYVTQIIGIVTKVKNEFFDLVFQGGTCLAKAHRIIKRMSEDCDFRVRAKAASFSLAKAAQRKALREFRHDIIAALRNNNFLINDDEIRVRNEGQFMSIRARYDSQFSHIDSIKPFLAIEFFLGDIKTSTLQKPVTTLIKQTLGDKVTHSEYPVTCVSVIETAVEKWVALTRRVATIAHRKHYRDNSLVRHLYDLYKIEEQGLFSYDDNKPSYDQVLNNIYNKTTKALAVLV